MGSFQRRALELLRPGKPPWDCVDANAAPCVLSAAGAAAEGVVTEADMGCAEEPEEALCWPAAELAPEGCCSEGSMVHCGVSACATPA